MTFALNCEVRDPGVKRSARKLRKSLHVPAVMYGAGETVLLKILRSELVKVLVPGITSTLVAVEIGGRRQGMS